MLDFKGPTTEKEDNHQSSMLESAKIFSEIWETGSGVQVTLHSVSAKLEMLLMLHVMWCTAEGNQPRTAGIILLHMYMQAILNWQTRS